MKPIRTQLPGTAVRVVALASLVIAVSTTVYADDRNEVTLPGDRAYPESITATSDGTLFTGSVAEGGVFRIQPGSTVAERWIAPGAGDSMSTFGVLADERSGTLWVCSNNATSLGVPPPTGPKPVALKAFDLKTGALKGSYPLPAGASFCNDAVVGPDGMRRFGSDALLMVEGAGRFDIVHLGQDGPARIEVVKSGYKGPVSVVQLGNVAWVLEGQLTSLFTTGAPKPSPFHAYAVPLPSH